MSNSTQLELSAVVEPFARVIDGRTGTVNQQTLNDLKSYYDATDHSAYKIETYEPGDLLTLRKGLLFNLPFRLALGIHSSIEPFIDEQATIKTFSEYQAVRPLMLTGDGASHEKRMKSRAESAACGAMIEAAMDGGHLARIREAHDFLRQERMISRASGNFAMKAVELVTLV